MPGAERIEFAEKPTERSVSRQDIAAFADPTTIGCTIPFNNGLTLIAEAITR